MNARVVNCVSQEKVPSAIDNQEDLAESASESRRQGTNRRPVRHFSFLVSSDTVFTWEKAYLPAFSLNVRTSVFVAAEKTVSRVEQKPC